MKIIAKGDVEDGYVQCNILRENWPKEETFDEFIKKKILLTEEDISSRNSNIIWENFQHKFTLTFELYNYHEFFREILTHILINSINEKVYIVELKHIFGCLIDDDHNFLDFEHEIKIFLECIEEAKEVEPLLEVRLVVCGLKIFGDAHIKEQIRCCLKGLNKYEIIAGFDLVNEEDTNPPLKTFRKLIKRAQEENPELYTYFHAGESSSRENDNLYDAILLGTKRIGHGFAIQNHPHITDLVIEKQICLEVCPLSNLVLGYIFDLRWHPARSLMHRGVPITINADDPGFWETDGVSLDYAYVTVAWELDLKELKQFALNSIKYSSIKNKEKVR
jgi:adenosine deaminase CECR1